MDHESNRSVQISSSALIVNQGGTLLSLATAANQQEDNNQALLLYFIVCAYLDMMDNNGIEICPLDPPTLKETYYFAGSSKR